MSPRSVQLATGKILTIAGGTTSGYVCDSVVDPLTGKIFVSASARALKDAFTYNNLPDQTAGLVDHIQFNAVPEDTPPQEVWMLIGGLPAGKNINCWCYVLESYLSTPPYTSTPFTAAIYETLNTWDEATVCWNNQPALGALVGEVSMGAVNSWWSFPTGTTGSIFIKTKETNLHTAAVFYSLQYTTDISKRPYIS